VLERGRSTGTFDKGDISVEELEKMMAGGAELDQLSAELEGDRGREPEEPADRTSS
jgi:simple sugar transport system ATP-binding protein